MSSKNKILSFTPREEKERTFLFTLSVAKSKFSESRGHSA
jgi:hypothetical protein